MIASYDVYAAAAVLALRQMLAQEPAELSDLRRRPRVGEVPSVEQEVTNLATRRRSRGRRAPGAGCACRTRAERLWGPRSRA